MFALDRSYKVAARRHPPIPDAASPEDRRVAGLSVLCNGDDPDGAATARHGASAAGAPGCSILFGSAGEAALAASAAQPEAYRDLNLDQVIDAVTTGRDEYDLKPYFYVGLADQEQVAARHRIFRDLEGG